jgi:hypothetical protein
MQSGKARAGQWILQHESSRRKRADPLTGWAGGADTQEQVTIAFSTLDAAKAYCERQGIAYHVVPAAQPSLKLQSYADKFN